MTASQLGRKEQEIMTFLRRRIFDPILQSIDSSERLKQGVRYTIMRITSADVSHMSAPQWAVVNEYRALMPSATVALRQHKISWKRDARVTLPPVFSVAVTQRVEPFTLRREYAAPTL